jgi:uncharacterized Zn-finger protein
MKYQSLIKAAPVITYISLSILAFALLSLNILSLINTKVTDEILVHELIFLFILLLTIALVDIISSSSRLDSLEYIGSIRTGLLIVYLYMIASILICSVIGPTAINLLSYFIPPYLALYLFIIIIIIVASFLTHEKYLESGEKSTFIIGLMLELVGIIVGLVIIGTIIAAFTGLHLFLAVATITALITYAWLRIENIIVRIKGSYTYGVFYSMIYRRVTTAILCIILALVALYHSTLYLSMGLHYSWTFRSVEEAFLLLICLSLALVVAGNVIGIVGISLFLPSEHGLRGLTLITRHKLSGGSMEELLKSLSIIQPSLKPVIQPPQPQQPTTPEVSPETQVSMGTRVVKKCSYCGKEVPPEAKFCPYCGALLEGDEGTRLYTTPTEKKQETQAEPNKGG